jgi:FkbM family methyltransferase
MKMLLKKITKNMLDKLGLEIRRTRPSADAFPSDPYHAQEVFIKKLGISKPVIFDVGAHQGETVSRYKEIFPESEIYCFEPSPDNAKRLRDRFSSDSSIHVYECAISDDNEIKTFYVNELDATNSLLPRTNKGRRYYSKSAGSKSSLEVKALTIDEIVKKESINHIDKLKFDIQGGELMALNGAKSLLSNGNVSLIYTEALFAPHYENNPLLLNIWQHLDQYGYTFFDIYDLFRATNGQLRFADIIFVNKQLREGVLDSYKAEP